MVNFGYPYNDLVICKDSTDYLVPSEVLFKFAFMVLVPRGVLCYRLAPMWQQSGTLLFCSCHGIAGFLVDELQI